MIAGAIDGIRRSLESELLYPGSKLDPRNAGFVEIHNLLWDRVETKILNHATAISRVDSKLQVRLDKSTNCPVSSHIRPDQHVAKGHDGPSPGTGLIQQRHIGPTLVRSRKVCVGRSTANVSIAGHQKVAIFVLQSDLRQTEAVAMIGIHVTDGVRLPADTFRDPVRPFSSNGTFRPIQQLVDAKLPHIRSNDSIKVLGNQRSATRPKLAVVHRNGLASRKRQARVHSQDIRVVPRRDVTLEDFSEQGRGQPDALVASHAGRNAVEKSDRAQDVRNVQHLFPKGAGLCLAQRNLRAAKSVLASQKLLLTST
mmetsp:Transcript_17168/g.33447  ORF Transcript_17168/g.33447 Transcript_17168/m.33447 type:complete len:311 (+) Transcript_17168:1247-2179(+)